MRNNSILSWVVVLLIVKSATANVLYNIVDIGTLGGQGSHAWGINDLGQVVGESQTISGVWHAFIWDSINGIQDIDTLGSGDSLAFCINNSGQVVGRYNYFPSQAFIWNKQNGMQPLFPKYYRSEAYGINDSGQIVGFYYDKQDSQGLAFLWDIQNGLQDLGDGFARSINNTGQIAGGWNNPREIALWTNGNVELLGTGQAHGINDSGWLVGSTYPSSPHGFIWNKSDGLRIISPYLQSSTSDINILGQVIGCEYDGPSGGWAYGWYAFIWDNKEGLARLDNLIEYTTTPYRNWRLSGAISLNNSGQIVGYGWHDDMPQDYGTAHAFIMTPVFETATCIKPIIGDLNNDCRVDFADLALMAANWMLCNLEPQSACW